MIYAPRNCWVQMSLLAMDTWVLKAFDYTLIIHFVWIERPAHQLDSSPQGNPLCLQL